jgi:regulator of sigma E protease
VTVVITLLALAVVLGVLIFVHEAGHFLAAKWAGIYVHRFSLGLGSPIRRLSFRRGETEYSVSWLPLGGYVKMASREEDSTSALLEGGGAAPVPPDRVFEAKPVWKRMVVIVAGVTMNLVFAWAAYTYVAAKHGRSIDPTTTVGRVLTDSLAGVMAPLATLKPGDRIVRIDGDTVVSWDEVVHHLLSGRGNAGVTIGLANGREIKLDLHPSAIEERARAANALLPFRGPVVDLALSGRPASRAGVEPGDSIVAVNGQAVSQRYDVLAIMDTSAGRPVTLTVARGGRLLELPMTASSERGVGLDGKPREVGRIGIRFHDPERTEPYTLLEAMGAGAEATFNSMTFIVRTVQGLLTRRVSASNVGGPILIAQQAGEFARLGFDPFLEFMALISVNLAVLNLLPVPVLDGGQLVMLLAEAVTRRPVPLGLRERLTMFGLVVVVLLMVLAFSNDIRRLLGG